MNPNRDCPGVPNRYSFRLRSMVTQPKSIATVVVVFPVASAGSSTPTDATVISASVVSGAISEIAPTVVVLPTAKPPATTIFTGTGGLAPVRPLAERTESTDHSQNGRGVIGVHCVERVHLEVTGGAQVVHQDPGDVEVQVQPGGDLGYRHRPLAEHHDRLALGGQPAYRGRLPG